jgi:exopolysaccharide biosynthesis WecB/TagA/CpsF family protein
MLIGAWIYGHWVAPLAAPYTGSDIARAAASAALLAPFVLYDKRFVSAVCHRQIAVLLRSHAMRFALFVVVVLVLGGLGHVFGSVESSSLMFWLVASLLLTSLARLLAAEYVRRLQRRGALTEVVALVGAGPVADRLLKTMRETRPESIALLGVFDDAAVASGQDSGRLTGSIDQLLELGKTRRIDWILLTAPPNPRYHALRVLNRLKALSVPIGLPQHVALGVPVRSIGYVGGSVPVSVLAVRRNDRWDRLRAYSEDLLPRWLITLASLPFAGVHGLRGRLAAIQRLRSRRRALPLSLEFDDYRVDDFSAVAARFGQETYGYAVTPNADHLIRLQEDHSFRPLYAAASYILLDSQFVAHALRVMRRLRFPVCTGSDLTQTLFSDVIGVSDRIVLIGGTEQQAAQIRGRFGLKRLTHFNPPMGFVHDPRAVERCLKVIETHSPFRFCLLAVGSPQQEMIAERLKTRGRARGLALCIGASIDFLTGVEHRAPLWMQRCGLEWSFRLLQDPRRLAQRYLVRGPRVFALLMRAQLRLRTAAVPPPGIVRASPLGDPNAPAVPAVSAST